MKFITWKLLVPVMALSRSDFEQKKIFFFLFLLLFAFVGNFISVKFLWGFDRFFVLCSL